MTRSTTMAWSLHELGYADYGDTRLTKRGVIIASSFLEHPQSSIPQVFKDWATTKATYRFFDNEKVQSDIMLESHHQQLRERVSTYDTILVAQDTTILNLSTKTITGAGRIGDGGKSGNLTGLFTHSALAMSPDGLPLGLTSQKTYARKDETVTDEYKRKAKQLPITEKETYRWIEAVSAAKAVLPDKHLVMIGDRESDIYEVFAQGQVSAVDLLVRTNQNRLLLEENEGGDVTAIKLFDKASSGEILATYEADIPIDHHRNRKAILTIRRSSILLPPPKTRNKNRITGKACPSIPLTVLNVQEEGSIDGSMAIHWMLTTSLAVTSLESAKEKVQWYIYRWRIERFHYTLKTGAFNIEKLQLETLARFKKAIMMYSLVAVRILYTLQYERDHSDDPATAIFSKDEVQALRLRELSLNRNNGTAMVISLPMTIHQAVTATAKIGGYLARRSDGSPGIKALWIGFQALRYIVEGIRLGKAISS